MFCMVKRGGVELAYGPACGAGVLGPVSGGRCGGRCGAGVAAGVGPVWGWCGAGVELALAGVGPALCS